MGDVLQNSPCPAFLVDAHGMISYVNSTARHWLMVDHRDAQEISSLVEQADRSKLAKSLEQARISGEQVDVTLRFNVRSLIPHKWRLLPLAQSPESSQRGEMTLMLGEEIELPYPSDHQRQLDNALRLEKALRAAQAANLAKCEFLANISHELRTPMAAILGYAELLSDQLQGECKEAANIVCRNGEHLLQIINNLLDISCHEAGQLQVAMEPVRLAELLHSVHEMMELRAKAKGLRLHTNVDVDDPTLALTDPVRLHQVLVNLVGNAIKFTEVGSVDVDVNHERSAGGREEVLIKVTDTGIGIPEEIQQRIFDPFHQADNSLQRAHGGTGLGLAVSHRLSQALCGTLEVRSTVGIGSQFTLRLPSPSNAIAEQSGLTPADLRRPVRRRLSSPPTDDNRVRLAGLRVLLVEDGPDNQRLITHILEKAGANVKLAVNGLECLKCVCPRELLADAGLLDSTPLDNLEAGNDLLHDRPDDDKENNSGPDAFDVILMDMQMPVMDGYKATKELRRLGHSGPIIALTAHAMPFDRGKCMASGCNNYFAKPIDHMALIEVMSQYVLCNNGRDV